MVAIRLCVCAREMLKRLELEPHQQLGPSTQANVSADRSTSCYLTKPLEKLDADRLQLRLAAARQGPQPKLGRCLVAINSHHLWGPLGSVAGGSEQEKVCRCCRQAPGASGVVGGETDHRARNNQAKLGENFLPRNNIPIGPDCFN